MRSAAWATSLTSFAPIPQRTQTMDKRIRATLYMESRISRKGFYAIRSPEGYLFADGRHLTKILPSDLPDWFVYGYLYKRHGYISSKGIKHLLYIPNYVFDNHLYKYDSLFISYSEEIKPVETDDKFRWYEGYSNLTIH